MKSYECRFAPCASNVRDVIRVSQLVHDRGVTAYEAIAPDAFKSRWTDAAIVIDHNQEQRAGTVTSVIGWQDWMVANFVLDGPHAAHAAELIERSGQVSPGFTWIERDPTFATPHSTAHDPFHFFTAARLDEISNLVARRGKRVRGREGHTHLRVEDTDPQPRHTTEPNRHSDAHKAGVSTARDRPPHNQRRSDRRDERRIAGHPSQARQEHRPLLRGHAHRGAVMTTNGRPQAFLEKTPSRHPCHHPSFAGRSASVLAGLSGSRLIS